MEQDLEEALGLALVTAPWIALLGSLVLAASVPSRRRLAWMRRLSLVVGVLLLVATGYLVLFTPVFVVLAVAAVVPLTAMREATERGAAFVGIYAGVMSVPAAAAWGAWALVVPAALVIGAVQWARAARAPLDEAALPLAMARH